MITALSDYPNVFLALKISGAAYVLWLAWKLIRAGRYDGQGGKASDLLGWGYFAYTIESLHNHGTDVQPVLSTDGGLQIANVLTISLFTLTTWLRFRFGPL